MIKYNPDWSNKVESKKDFTISYRLLFSNFLVAVLMVIIIGFFSKLSIIKIIYGDLFVIFALAIYLIISKKMLSVTFFKEEKKVSYNFIRLFYRQSLELVITETLFSYKSEITGRGSKSHVLSFFTLSGNKLIKIIPVISSWSESQIEEIVATCKELNMQQVSN